MLSHFVHGDQIDENDSKDDKEDFHKALLNPIIFDQISGLICNLIPEVNRLKELFMCWTILKPEEKAIMDARVSHYSGLVLYNPLIEAMRRWEFLQDTQGAPGCEAGMVTLNDPSLEQALANTVVTVEHILSNFEVIKSNQILKSTSAAELVADSFRYLCEGEKCETHYNTEIKTSSCTRILKRSVSMGDIINLHNKPQYLI